MSLRFLILLHVFRVSYFLSKLEWTLIITLIAQWKPFIPKMSLPIYIINAGIRNNILKFTVNVLCVFSVVLFCLAAVIFPCGFSMEQIGGEAYQLPGNYQVGISYIFFVMSLWLTVVSELFAGKVCLPHFWKNICYHIYYSYCRIWLCTCVVAAQQICVPKDIPNAFGLE